MNFFSKSGFEDDLYHEKKNMLDILTDVFSENISTNFLLDFKSIFSIRNLAIHFTFPYIVDFVGRTKNFANFWIFIMNLSLIQSYLFYLSFVTFTYATFVLLLANLIFL